MVENWHGAGYELEYKYFASLLVSPYIRLPQRMRKGMLMTL